MVTQLLNNREWLSSFFIQHILLKTYYVPRSTVLGLGSTEVRRNMEVSSWTFCYSGREGHREKGKHRKNIDKM